MSRSVHSMTAGSPTKQLLGFIGPMLFGLLFQQFYFMADLAIVGKILGVTALAGVGSTGSINFLILGFCNGLCAGFSIPIAQRFGAQDSVGLRRVAGSMVWLGLGLSFVLTLGSSLLCRNILVWMHTPTETFHCAYQYLLVILLGIPATILYNILAGVIRSLGNSRAPLYFLIIGSLINIFLDFAFILWAGWGVIGAALASVAAQLISGLLCLWYILLHFPLLHFSRDDLRPRWAECRLLLGMGVPMGLQYSITAIGCIMLQSSINGLGPIYMAADTAACRLNGLFACPLDAMGMALTTFTGQNVGARKMDRVRAGCRSSLGMGIFYTLVAILILQLWAAPLAALFVDASEAQGAAVIAAARRYVLICSWCYPIIVCLYVLRFSVQGMGFSRWSMLAGIAELFARAVFALSLVPHFGFPAVCWSSPASWLLAVLVLLPVYFLGVQYLQKKFVAEAC